MSYSSIILGTSGLTSYWRLGETSGTSAADSAGSTTGTYVGGYTLGQTGALVGDANKAVALDGSTGLVSLGTTLTVGAADFTIEAWIKATSTTGTRCIFARDRTSNPAYQMRFALGEITAGKVGFGFSNAAGSAGPRFEGSTTLTTATWYHVAVSRAGSVYTIYVNGTSDGTQTNAAAIDNAGSTFDTRIGSRMQFSGTNAQNAFAGSIDDVSLYSRALTASELLSHYRVGLAARLLRLRREVAV